MHSSFREMRFYLHHKTDTLSIQQVYQPVSIQDKIVKEQLNYGNKSRTLTRYLLKKN